MNKTKVIISTILIVLSLTLVGCQADPVTTTITETKTVTPAVQTTTVTAIPQTVTITETRTVTDIASTISTTTSKTTSITSSLETEVTMDDELLSGFNIYVSSTKVTTSGVVVKGGITCTLLGQIRHTVGVEGTFYDASGTVLGIVTFDEEMLFVGNGMETRNYELDYTTDNPSDVAKCVVHLILISKEG